MPAGTGASETDPVLALPDYELAERVNATTTEHFKALGDPTRRAIIDLVLERAATTTELAAALGKPKGTIDHHLKVLERNGFMQVVRTRQVRAMTEKFWGRTARTIVFNDDFDPEQADGHCHNRFLAEAVAETNRMAAISAEREPAVDTPAERAGSSGLRHARVPAKYAKEFGERLDAMSVEFAAAPRDGDVVYGFVYAVYATDLPTLPEPAKENR